MGNTQVPSLGPVVTGKGSRSSRFSCCDTTHDLSSDLSVQYTDKLADGSGSGRNSNPMRIQGGSPPPAPAPASPARIPPAYGMSGFSIFFSPFGVAPPHTPSPRNNRVHILAGNGGTASPNRRAAHPHDHQQGGEQVCVSPGTIKEEDMMDKGDMGMSPNNREIQYLNNPDVGMQNPAPIIGAQNGDDTIKSPQKPTMCEFLIDENRDGNIINEALQSPRSKKPLFRKGSLTFDRKGKEASDFYDFEDTPLGQGTYGQVLRGKHKETNVYRAVKVVDKNRLKNYVKNASEFVRRELDVLRRLDHPNIVKIYETFEDLRYLYIILEICEGGDLLTRILHMDQFRETTAAHLLKEILSAVYYMHESQFIHRDLKPDNFLFSSEPANDFAHPPLKLIDFGLAKRILRDSLAAPTPHIGTPAYMAPEVHEGNYNEKADVWSVGVILHVLLSGRFPNLSSAPTPEAYFAHDTWDHVSPDGRALMCAMLQKDPRSRCTAVHALQHPWVQTLAQNAKNVNLHSAVVSNLSDFMSDASLKKMALNVVAREMSEGDIEDLKKLFQEFDINGDGTLTFDEMKQGIDKCQDSKHKKTGVDFLKLFEEIDTDGSGSVDYTEFLASSLDRQRYTQEAVLWKAFKSFDVDGSGAISSSELHQVLNQESVGKIMKKSLDELEALVTEVDLDGDGEIDFDEFLQMMRA